jgi:hypothetical protein
MIPIQVIISALAYVLHKEDYRWNEYTQCIFLGAELPKYFSHVSGPDAGIKDDNPAHGRIARANQVRLPPTQSGRYRQSEIHGPFLLTRTNMRDIADSSALPTVGGRGAHGTLEQAGWYQTAWRL